MAPSRAIIIGDRFRDLQISRLEKSRLDWVVEGFFTGRDEIEYVRLACSVNTAEKKTLSRDILEDRSRFQLVDNQS